MNFMNWRIVVRGAVTLFAVTALVAVVGMAQSEPAPPPAPPHGGMFLGGPGSPVGMMGGEFGEGKAVTGAPMSGVLVVTRDTTLADGNRIHSETQTKVYRDSQGRVRRELAVDLLTPATGSVKHNVVLIIDPVARQRFLLNPDNKTAREMPMRGSHHGGPDHPGAMRGPGGPGEPGSVTKEQLGTKTVNGMQAEGVRVTRTIPAGAIGNDKPINVVTERWYSSDLQIPIMTVHNDPMMGTVTTTLTNVTRGDPDASLFQVPSDYKVDSGKPGEPMFMPAKP